MIVQSFYPRCHVIPFELHFSAMLLWKSILLPHHFHIPQSPGTASVTVISVLPISTARPPVSSFIAAFAKLNPLPA
ncbi:hypothetical protein I7I48_10905 [Histoplasma ohiense]|nr:hypothetical protein I7I48_10905 [Histoplasma ohiense (nom. inval.)]